MKIKLPAEHLQETPPASTPSPLSALITQTITKLASTAEINYVAQNWGQLDFYGNQPPVHFPCVLIDATAATYEELGKNPDLLPSNRQKITGMLSITVANVPPHNPSSNAPETLRNDALKIFELMEIVHRQLHGWNSLIRTSFNKSRREDGIQEYTIDYRFSAIDV